MVGEEIAKRRHANGTVEKQEVAKPRIPRLLSWKCCPPWLQFNPFILEGYRCELSTYDCVNSLFYLHNESVNVFSHGVPCLLILVLLPLMTNSACLSQPLWFASHYFACVAPFFASPLYHLFMCHESGERTYNRLLAFDLCGVWCTNAFGYLCAIRAMLYCHPLWSQLTLFSYVSITVYILYHILVATTAAARLKPLLAFGVTRCLLLLVRLTLIAFGHGRGNNETVWFYVLMDFSVFVGGIVNVARIPERWMPGKCDIIGNSHQIMHVSAVISVLCLHVAAMQDFEWMEKFQCP